MTSTPQCDLITRSKGKAVFKESICENFFKKIFKKGLTNPNKCDIISKSLISVWEHSSAGRASALQAEGHRFEPYCSHQSGPVAQLVRAPACHAGGRGFEPHPGRHFRIQPLLYASVAQLVEQGTENPRVVGSIPTGGTICGFSSFGRAPPCQGGGGGFEPRNPLHTRARIIVPVFIQTKATARMLLNIYGTRKLPFPLPS